MLYHAGNSLYHATYNLPYYFALTVLCPTIAVWVLRFCECLTKSIQECDVPVMYAFHGNFPENVSRYLFSWRFLQESLTGVILLLLFELGYYPVEQKIGLPWFFNVTFPAVLTNAVVCGASMFLGITIGKIVLVSPLSFFQ